MRPIFQVFQIRNQSISFPSSPCDQLIPKDRYQVRLSCQIDEFSSDLSVKSDDYSAIAPKRIIGPLNILQIVFHTEFFP